MVLDGHKSHKSIDFQAYCKLNNIITLKLLPYLSYLTQLFNIECFGPFKQLYSCQIKRYIKAYINYITKIEFFTAFKAAYLKSITIQNIKSSFRETGLIPFDPESILLKLDIRIHTVEVFYLLSLVSGDILT